jgi:hypothetical protein
MRYIPTQRAAARLSLAFLTAENIRMERTVPMSSNCIASCG